MALSIATREATLLKKLINDFGLKINKFVIIHCEKKKQIINAQNIFLHIIILLVKESQVEIYMLILFHP